MRPIPTSADVVVIGGGPAGSTTANLLAERGYDVVLLEQARHPRPTVGESVLPHMWKYADTLGVTKDIEDAGFLLKSGGLTIWNGEIRQALLSDFGFDRPGMHVERDRFDKILLDGAARRGARVYEEVRVTRAHLEDETNRGVSWEDKSSGERGRTRCKVIVDGSGQAAVIANQSRFRAFDPDLRFVCIWGYFSDSAYVSHGGFIRPFDERWQRDRRPMTFASSVGNWGWCWHLVQRDHTSVGLVLAPEDALAFKARPGGLEERFLAALREIPGISLLLESARLVPDSIRAIRDFAYRPTQLCGDGWYLVGDASSFVDPINGAGVLVAFYTGSFAAWAVASTLERPDKEHYYRELFDAQVRQRVSLYRISALPEGVNSYADEDYPLALKAALLERPSEQEILLVQT
ncbi:MAG: NAD(P)/FAD-dependent oxidoreductase, partial [Nannocystaceae bacterium]